MESNDDYDYETLKSVGKMSYEALQHGKGLIKPGATMLGIADAIENYIREKGFDLAFPVNISVNENAAHYTPSFDDKSVIPDNGVVKLDVGARKGHYLGDCALTVDLSNNYGKLVEASQEALESAISMIKAGRQVNQVGKEIERIAASHGFAPIRNLGGHGIEQHELHAGVFVPNYDNGDTAELEEGQVIAIEPFMTDGGGYVREGEVVEIFQKTGSASVRSSETRSAASYIDEKYLTYPFAARWLMKGMKETSEFAVRKALTELSYVGVLDLFPVLVEKKRGMVSQSEKEMIVEKDSCTVVTL